MKIVKWFRLNALLLSIISSSCFAHDAIGQSLTGTTGLINTPVAEIQSDGEFAFGVNVLNKKHLAYFDGQQHTNVYFATLSFLPFLEVGLRYTRAWDPGSSSVGDRMVSVRVQIVKETRRLPSLAVGVHDALSTVGRHFNALYVVGSKDLSNIVGVQKTTLHLGYGADWIKARNHDFVGLFGGLSWSPSAVATVMFEYDADRFNAGLRLSVLNHVGILVGLENFDAICGGVSYRIELL
jgi:hypothetical protein